MKEKVKVKVERERRKVIACRQKEAVLVTDVKQDGGLIPENKG